MLSIFTSFFVFGLTLLLTTKKQEIVHTDHLDIYYSRTRQGGVSGTVTKAGHFTSNRFKGPFAKFLSGIRSN